MSKLKRKVYGYDNDKKEVIFQSILECSQTLKVVPQSIKDSVNKKRFLKGFALSFQQLSKSDIDEYRQTRPKKEKKETKAKPKGTFKVINDQAFEVHSLDDRIFHFPKSKKEKLEKLRQFIHQRLQTRWQTIDKKMATLEREFIREMFESLE